MNTRARSAAFKTMVLLALMGFVWSSATAQQITLRFNTLFHSGDAQAMERIVEKFNEEHTDVRIELTQGQWTDYYAQLYSAVVAGNAPQIGVVHSTQLPRMAVALTPLIDSPAGDLLEAAGIRGDDFPSNMWAAGEYEGVRYLVPFDTPIMGLYYNKDIFREAGLDPEAPPETREEFEAAAQAIMDATDKYPAHLAGFGAPRVQRRAFSYLLWQQGGELFNEDYTEAAFNDELGLNALRYLVSTVQEKGWNIPDGNGYPQFAAGELGMLVAGNWFYWTALDAGVDFGVHYTPTFFDQRATWGNSHNLVIPRQPAGTPDEVYVAAAEAIKWISENADLWGIYGGHLPAYLPVRESAALLESETWQVSLSKFARMIDEGAMHYSITHQDGAEVNAALENFIQQAYNGTITPEVALARAEAEVNAILGGQ